jgi:hypothetical protein
VESKKAHVVIYTALFGNYDKLIDPPKNSWNCDFICFTDDEKIKSKIWTVVLVKEEGILPNILNRYYKFHPHFFLKQYKYSIYVDSNILVWKDPTFLVEKYMKDFSIAAPKHPLRSCIYEEAKEIVLLGKASPIEVKKQVESYSSQGFPKGYGLCEMNIIIRKHDCDAVVKLMDRWWTEYNSWSKRDQLSFYYSVWKMDVSVGQMFENSRQKNGCFFVECHKNDGLLKKLRRKLKKELFRLSLHCKSN